MKKSVCLLTFLIIAVLLLMLANINAINVTRKISNKSITGEITGESVTGESVTGKPTQSLNMNISVTAQAPKITITSPLNTTYNFNIGDNYTLDLNVSANFVADTWWYTLLDITRNTTVNVKFGFGVYSVSTKINVFRRSNKLIVYANNTNNTIFNKNVTFYVNVPNSAPLIEYLEPELFVCEESYLSYYFNVTDIDEDILTSAISHVDSTSPFYVGFSSIINLTKSKYEIYSGTLNKTHAGGPHNGWRTYEEIISITDNYNATCCSDSKQTNITIIEINSAPIIKDIGVQTVWTRGENSIFYKQVNVTDKEDGNQDSGNLTFNITIINSTGNTVNLFNISSFGVINYTGNVNQTGVYNISICVTDNGLKNPHQNMTDFCGQNGNNKSSCTNFSLTVTVENRRPNITSYYPTNLSLNVNGTSRLLFNITKNDPDGTIPDTYWYVDGFLIERDYGSNYDEFSYSFGCAVSGNHIIKVEITDGLLNDSVQWNLTVNYAECPAPSVAGVGGVAGGVECIEKWGCKSWGTCQNLEKALKEGILSGEDYRNVKDYCLKNNRDEKYCGFQNKLCFELNKCNKTQEEKIEIQECYYTEKPNCYDGIKNCHNGGCELLVDCGGPCLPCPSCSDKIKNQGEEGIDCGGPCPWTCPIEKPLPPLVESVFKYSVIALLIILLIIITIESVKIIEIRKRIKKEIKKIEISPKIYYSILIIAILVLAVFFFYYYSKFEIGDFVYKKDNKNLIGEIKNKSLILKPTVQWQDGRYDKEYVFDMRKIDYLSEREIRNALQMDNEQNFSLYYWTEKGKAALPEMPIKTVEDLKNYAIKIKEEDCIPGFICGEWSNCQVSYDLENMAKEELSFGRRYKYCKDYTECMSDLIYSEKCEIKESIVIEKTKSKEKDYIELYDSENRLVARITRRYVDGIEKLDIEVVV